MQYDILQITRFHRSISLNDDIVNYFLLTKLSELEVELRLVVVHKEQFQTKSRQQVFLNRLCS
jgi:hypothetical protein